MFQFLRLKTAFFKLFLTLVFISLTGCRTEKKPKETALFKQYCASCHIAPKIDDLPKDVWKNSVLPKMAEMIEIEEMYQDPNLTYSVPRPKIKLADWVLLSEYIIENAPEQLDEIKQSAPTQQSQFLEIPQKLSENNSSLTTYLQFIEGTNKIFFGNTSGKLASLDMNNGAVTQLFLGSSPITWYSRENDLEAITEVGILDPSQMTKGKFSLIKKADTIFRMNELHRPVFHQIADLNNNGKQEILLAQFGHETGKFSLFHQTNSGEYEEKILLNLPGVIKTEIKDVDGNGKYDIIVMSTQAYEGVVIFYQRGNLEFEAVKALSFSPVYGSSWFELVDFNDDGFDDIVTVNGDNADYSYVHKPYHGLRIHINDGKNQFEERFFFPLYGATRFVSEDFDGDGDIDFGVVSTFPNYEENPELSFVYLKNENSENFRFEAEILKDPNLGRWFLIDSGDIDFDGDKDIILSSFSYSFTPVPESFKKKWNSSKTDLLILKNKLYQPDLTLK